MIGVEARPLRVVDERAHPHGLGDRGDAHRDAVVGLVTELLADLLEVDPVVARIPAAHFEPDLAVAPDRLLNDVDDHPLRVVLVGVADVEHLAGDLIRGRVEDRHHRLGDVGDMAIRPPGIGVVDDELLARGKRVGELGDGQVEAHPRRQAVRGRDPQHRRRVVDARCGSRQDPALDLDLLLGVQGDRR